MSSEFNLSPDPKLVVIQAGIFLVELLIVKKLFVEPYLKVKDARDKQTVGNAGQAQKILNDCSELAGQIEKKVRDTSIEANRAREDAKAKASAARDVVIKQAEGEAKKQFDMVKTEIQSDLANQKAKIPELIKALASELYTKVTTA